MGYKKDNEKDDCKIGTYVNRELFAKIKAISDRTGLGMSRTVRDIITDSFGAAESKKEYKK